MRKQIVIRPRRSWILIGAVVALTAALVAPTAVWASHTFTDVPDESVFHSDIEWLAMAGITRGCNPPVNDRYCPDDEVTRGQMAAFMRRLAEGGSVDAGSVNGLQAPDLVRAAYGVADEDALVGVEGDAAEAMLTANGPGFLIIGGSADISVAGDGTDEVECRLVVDTLTLEHSRRGVGVGGPQTGQRSVCATDGVFPVGSEGTFRIALEFLLVDPGTTVDRAALTAIFVPFDGAGQQP